MKKTFFRIIISAALAAIAAVGCDNGVTTKSGKVDELVNMFRNDKNKPDAGKYTVTVSSAGTGATGGGEYTPSAAVTVTAGTPPNGYQFIGWTSSNAEVIFVPNDNSQRVMFSMP